MFLFPFSTGHLLVMSLPGRVSLEPEPIFPPMSYCLPLFVTTMLPVDKSSSFSLFLLILLALLFTRLQFRHSNSCFLTHVYFFSLSSLHVTYILVWIRPYFLQTSYRILEVLLVQKLLKYTKTHLYRRITKNPRPNRLFVCISVNYLT